MYTYKIKKDCFFANDGEDAIYYREGSLYTSQKKLKKKPSYFEEVAVNIKKEIEERLVEKQGEIVPQDNTEYQRLRMVLNGYGEDTDRMLDRSLASLRQKVKWYETFERTGVMPSPKGEWYLEEEEEIEQEEKEFNIKKASFDELKEFAKANNIEVVNNYVVLKKKINDFLNDK